MPPKAVGGAKQRARATQAAERSRSPAHSHPPPHAPVHGADRGGARQRNTRGTSSADLGSSQAAGPTGGQDFFNHVATLFLKNKFSGAETVKLVASARRAGGIGDGSIG